MARFKRFTMDQLKELIICARLYLEQFGTTDAFSRRQACLDLPAGQNSAPERLLITLLHWRDKYACPIAGLFLQSYRLGATDTAVSSWSIQLPRCISVLSNSTVDYLRKTSGLFVQKIIDAIKPHLRK